MAQTDRHHSRRPKGDTLTPFLFICLDYVLRTSDKANDLGFTLSNARSGSHPAITITDADSADDRALMAETIGDAQALLHSLEPAAGDSGRDETEFSSVTMKKARLTHPLARPSVNSIYLGHGHW